MSHSSEDRLQDPDVDLRPATARIIPFERPPTELQRAVQMRAQEALERDRDRQKTRPAPLRWAVIMVLTTIPVFLVFGAVDAFVRAFQRLNASYATMPAPEAPASSTQSASQPGVVMLSPLPPEDAAPAERSPEPAVE